MARRGRKRLVKRRYVNGHVAELRQRDLEAEARQVAHSARERVHGLSCVMARLSEATDPLGRALLSGKISPSEFEAGREYEKLYRQWVKVVCIKPLASSGNLNQSTGYDADEGDDPAYVEHCRIITDRINESRGSLVTAGRLSQLAVDTWCIEQKAAWGLVPPLKLGLRELVRLYRIGNWLKNNDELPLDMGHGIG